MTPDASFDFEGSCFERKPGMSPRSLHPLARQAVILSGRTDCYGWAFGLTKYLAHRDPIGCVRWTLNFVLPHVQDTGEYADVVRRSTEFLEEVLAQPNRVSLQAKDEFAWLPWSHRWVIKGANSLARLIWASMGAVVVAQPDIPSSGELPALFHSDEDPIKVAEKSVWGQCATAIHALADDEPTIPTAAATYFTKRVCRATPPSAFTLVRRLEWSWQELSFEVAVLREASDAFHLQFIDRQGKEPLF